MAETATSPELDPSRPEYWARLRHYALSPVRPEEWPPGIRSISTKGLGLLGIHEKTQELYWDGRKVLVRSRVRLGTFERWVAGIAAMGTFGNFVVQLARAFGVFPA